MKHRIALVISCCLVALSLLPVIHVRAADAIQSPILEPVPQTYSDSLGLHVKMQWVLLERRGSSDVYCLHVYDCVFPSNTQLRVNVYFNGLNAAFRSTEQPLSGTHEVYDVQTGEYLIAESITLANWNYTVDSVAYRYYVRVVNCVNNGFFDASDSFVVEASWATQYEIEWAHEETPLNYYSTLLAEPVADEYNRYFALVGETYKYLFQVHFWASEMITLQLTNPDQTTETYFDIRGLFAPVVRLENNVLSVSYECVDPDMLDLLNATTQAEIQGLKIQITKYDFYTGAYEDSFLFEYFQVANSGYTFQYNLGNYNDYDAIGVWGVYYDSFNSSYHYNKLACVWSYNPSFEQWQTNTLQFLQLIYNVLSQQPEEDPTINDDMSAVNEVESVIDSLQPTDENGQRIDTAEKVQSELNRANAEIESLRTGASSLNRTMENFLFMDPLFYVPLLVALALGLVITILGKNKSD